MNANDIDITIISRMTKYAVLQEILKGYTNLLNAKVVNLFIDLRSILGKIFVDVKKEGMSQFIFEEQKIFMCSTLVNLMAHYRKFFFDNGIDTRIFCYYTNSTNPEMKKVNPLYKKSFEADRNVSSISDLVYINLNLTKEILKYVSNVFLIDTGMVDERIFPFVALKMSSKMQNEENIILSNDPFYANYLKYNSYSVLTMKGDHSKYYVGNNENARDLYIQKKKDTDKVDFDFDEKMLSVYMAVSGDKKVDIDGLPKKGPKKAIKFINSLVEIHKLTNCIYTYPMLKSDLDKIEFDHDIDKERILKNFRLLDLEELLKFFSKQDILKIKQQVYKKENNFYALDDLNRLNLREHPIKVDFLLKNRTFH